MSFGSINKQANLVQIKSFHMHISTSAQKLRTFEAQISGFNSEWKYCLPNMMSFMPKYSKVPCKYWLNSALNLSSAPLVSRSHFEGYMQKKTSVLTRFANGMQITSETQPPLQWKGDIAQKHFPVQHKIQDFVDVLARWTSHGDELKRLAVTSLHGHHTSVKQGGQF